MAANWSLPIMPVVSGVTGGVQRHHVGALEQLVEGDRRLVGVGVVDDDLHPEAAEPPPQGAADRTESDQADRPAGQLPGPEPLVGDGAVLVDVAPRARRRRRPPGRGWRRTAGRPSARPPRRRCAPAPAGPARPASVAAATSTLFGSPRQLHTATSGSSKSGTGAPVALDDGDGGALGLHPVGQLLGVVDAQRRLVEPGVEGEVGQLAEEVESRAADRGRHQRLRSSCRTCVRRSPWSASRQCRRVAPPAAAIASIMTSR